MRNDATVDRETDEKMLPSEKRAHRHSPPDAVRLQRMSDFSPIAVLLSHTRRQPDGKT